MSVGDTTPPRVTCSATVATLKSNDHKLAAITTTVTVADERGGSGANGFILTSVKSNQADSGLAADDVPNDIQNWTTGTADTSGLLRAERYGSDRVYTITYQGSDVAGNKTNCQTTVTVRKAS
jgi:endo-1,4-beta-xylanase